RSDNAGTYDVTVTTVKGHDLLRGYGTRTFTRRTGSPGPSGAFCTSCPPFLDAAIVPSCRPLTFSCYCRPSPSLLLRSVALSSPCRAKRRRALLASNPTKG